MSTPTAFTVEDIQRDWPHWRIWRTENWWNATRRPPRLDVPTDFFSRRGNIVLTLMEDGPRELLAALENQAVIEEEIAKFGDVDHSVEHTIGPRCPISCLGLQQATEDALVMHWRGEGQHAPTIRDLLRLRLARDLTSLFGVSWARASEIDRKLKALELVNQA